MIEKTNRYQILEELGQGGFATVYRARDTELDRMVALKELHPHLLTDSDWVDRFRREARLIARLNHPHIVPIYDIGQTGSRQFLIMSLVEGPGLDKLLANRGRLPWAEALEIIWAVAKGLDYAHSQHILHRDLKPANILMDPSRGPLLGDFGLAKLMSDHSLSESGSIVGTAHYIPPEIWDGEPATPQTDIYALGCILYELLIGERLFGGNAPPAIMMAHFRPLILPKAWPAGVPPSVAEVLNIALAKQPKDRYTTAAEMVEALLNLTSFENLSGVEVSPALPPPSSPTHIDWGEAPDVINFYGRETEVEQLARWLTNDRCRLVAVLGMGGLGKTTLVTRLTDQLQNQFTYIIWRSLRNAPPLEELLEEWLLFLSDQQLQDLPMETNKRLSRLMEHLRQKRCLLILDNLETILHEEEAGHYQPGYEAYGQLLQRIGESRHQSCLVLTSREKPAEFVSLEGETGPVRSLELPHLTLEAGRALLRDKGLEGSDENWQALIERYSGNPLALKVVAETIRELFKGNIAAFLTGDTAIFGGIRKLLAEQFNRLSPLEQEIMTWLAIEREAIGPEQLQENLVQSPSQRELLERLQALRRRSLLERGETGFTLQNVMMEYITVRLVETVGQEIIEGEVTGHLKRYALLKAQAKEYVRASQTRLILQPIIEWLHTHYGPVGCEARLKELVEKLRQTAEVLETSAVSTLPRGYAGGNLLNLLLHLKPEARGLDFSGLSVWQAYLQGMRLQGVNFSQTDLSGSIFTEIFGAVSSVAFNPDGRLLAVGTDDGRVWLRQTDDGQLLLTCEGHTDGVWSVCFSPDGQIIASSSSDQTIRLWDIYTGHCLNILEGHNDGIWSLDFSPNGQTLVSGSQDQTVRLWEVSTGHCLNILKGHTGAVRSVCFSPGGQIIASGSFDQTICLWNIDNGERLNILKGHSNEVDSVSFSPDGQCLASGSADCTIRLWDAHTGQCFEVLEGHTNGVRSVYFSPDGRTLASGAWDQTIRLWEVNTGHCFRILQGHNHGIAALSLSPDGQTLASGSQDQTVRLWEVDTGQCLRVMWGYSGKVNSVCFSPDGQVLASGNADRVIHLWDTETGGHLSVLKGHTGEVWSICFSPDGQILASSGQDQTIRLWERDSKRCLKILQGHSSLVSSVCFSPDGQTIASTGGDRTVRVWDIHTGQCLKILQGHTNWANIVHFSADGRMIASSGGDWTIRLWDVDTGQCLKTLEGHSSYVLSVRFSPDGQIIASGGGDRTLRLWDVHTGQCLKALEGHTLQINTICFSPDGQTLATGSEDRTICLWNINTDQCFSILQEHTGSIVSVNFSPNGQTLASGGNDETVRLWQIRNGGCLKILHAERPYERLNITGATGLSEAQKAALKALGAYEE